MQSTLAPRMRFCVALSAALVVLTGTPQWTRGQNSVLNSGDGPALSSQRITQSDIESGDLPLHSIRRAGRIVFATPFNHHDGYGDGPMDPDDTVSPGGRPTLQGNGMFLRVNGLDAQSCLECHSVLSHATVPAKFGVGGVGGSASNAMFQPTFIDVDDSDDAGMATFNGRFINPPFLFGAGGIELLAKEMTADLQALKAFAQANPGTKVPLETKGVNFGALRFDNGRFDYSGVEGIDPDLVVRPFGRKGEFPTTRAFDVDAMMFHFGMQPVEAVGEDVDADGDGVMNEMFIGELSALSIFTTTMETPRRRRHRTGNIAGETIFNKINCADCHKSRLVTHSSVLTYSFPEVPTDPSRNIYYAVDLADDLPRFTKHPLGGLVIPLFSDLKRHNMGAELAESFGSDLDAMFITARLWGVADTAPYLHDGRAHTLKDAILMHGGDAQDARDAFAGLPDAEQDALLGFLGSLRTPDVVGADFDD